MVVKNMCQQNSSSILMRNSFTLEDLVLKRRLKISQWKRLVYIPYENHQSFPLAYFQSSLQDSLKVNELSFISQWNTIVGVFSCEV